MKMPEPIRLRDCLRKHIGFYEKTLKDIEGWKNINPQNPIKKVFEGIEERTNKELKRCKELLEEF